MVEKTYGYILLKKLIFKNLNNLIYNIINNIVYKYH